MLDTSRSHSYAGEDIVWIKEKYTGMPKRETEKIYITAICSIAHQCDLFSMARQK